MTEAVGQHKESLPVTAAEVKRTMSQVATLQRRAIDSGRYDEAQKQQKTMRALTDRLDILENGNSIDKTVQEKADKREELQAIIDRFVGDWNTSFQDFLQATRDQAEQIKCNHAVELARFEAQFPDRLPLQYRQQSRKLLDLREKERTLALAKRFVDAQKVKNFADQMQAGETEQQIQNMETDFERRRQKLIARHKQEMAVFFTHVEDTRTRMVQQRDQLIGGYMARIRKLTRQLEGLGPQEPESCVSAERTAVVTDGEYSYPIPRIRAGSTFTHARKERRDR
jgi:hypothetical protein